MLNMEVLVDLGGGSRITTKPIGEALRSLRAIITSESLLPELKARRQQLMERADDALSLLAMVETAYGRAGRRAMIEYRRRELEAAIAADADAEAQLAGEGF